MPDESNLMKAFIVLLSGAFIVVAITNLFPANTEVTILRRLFGPSVIVPFLIGIALFSCLAISFPPSVLNVVRATASSAWAWLCLVGAVWAYLAILSLIALGQRDRSSKMVDEVSKIIHEDINPFRLALQKLVLPRRLTPEQIATIEDYLDKHDKGTVNFVIHKYDNEAGVFAGEIMRVLRDSGWTIGKVEHEQNVEEGMRIDYRHPPSEGGYKDDPRHPKPNKILQDAFGLAGIQVGAGEGSGIATTTEELKITIGARRRDGSADFQKWQ